ncbi:serine/threonine-protein kinase [Sorangium sp. So ce1389]|uniref:serine/threonine-protein kinase n=1 Tax=Sorangium sp. So ce1389 TaxID=3133336 RepID=UPI003F62FB1B
MICPRCHRGYADRSYVFCPDDGARLVQSLSAAPPAQPTRQFGAVLEDRYVIQGFIGAGGMSRVYLAVDSHTKEQVAIKILNRTFAADRTQRERFLRELEVAAELGHPNIIRVLDAGSRKDGSPFIVLELLTGESLGSLLRREVAVSEAVALPLIRQAASALAAAHAAGVIHRDVKPDNMFLVRSASGPRLLKMMDFGFAKLRSGPATAAGLVLGTVPYMAPEQALADPVDGRTDVYALGITMYRMLAGQLPFSSSDDVVVVAQHACTAAPRLSAIRPGIDRRLEALVATALRKLPGNRFDSMQSLLEDVERILGARPGEPIGAPLRKAPDVYEPVNPAAREALKFLRRQLP